MSYENNVDENNTAEWCLTWTIITKSTWAPWEKKKNSCSASENWLAAVLGDWHEQMDGLQTILLPVPVWETLLIHVTCPNVCWKMFCCLFPLKSKTICTVKTSTWATGIDRIILVGYNSVYFFFWRNQTFSGCHTCAYTGGSGVILKVLDSVLYSLEPFMLVTNFVTSLKIIRANGNQNY